MLARTKIVLELGGDKYPIQSFNYSLKQHTDHIGQPASEVLGGSISLVLESPEKDKLLEWMCDSYLRQDGKIIVHKSEELGKFKELEFKQAFMTDYNESFAESGIGTISLTISCIEIKMGEAVHLNEWVED